LPFGTECGGYFNYGPETEIFSPHSVPKGKGGKLTIASIFTTRAPVILIMTSPTLGPGCFNYENESFLPLPKVGTECGSERGRPQQQVFLISLKKLQFFRPETLPTTRESRHRVR
jgi:hypothetical protein